MTQMWITKYALTKGIYLAEGELHTPDWGAGREYFKCATGVTGCFSLLVGRTCFHTLEEAQAQAEKMRKKKMLSLKVQLTKLANMSFEPKGVA